MSAGSRCVKYLLSKRESANTFFTDVFADFFEKRALETTKADVYSLQFGKRWFIIIAEQS